MLHEVSEKAAVNIVNKVIKVSILIVLILLLGLYEAHYNFPAKKKEYF